MNHLTRNDYASALEVLERIEANADSTSRFAQATVQALAGFVACERTALSVCDLLTGRSHLVGLPIDQVGADSNWHSGLDHVIAVPLFRSRRLLVTVVVGRRRPAFDERDRARLELLRPHLAFLYCHARRAHFAEAAMGAAPEAPQRLMPLLPTVTSSDLTPREAEVMQWLARAKTDAEIAALLSISPRTVQKHLEHIYVKLGVETRTAAVMRTLAGSRESAQRADPVLGASW